MEYRRARWIRLGALVALIGGLWIIARVTGFSEQITADSVRDMMVGAGLWGFLLFLLLFSVAELVHIPGLLFLAAAVLAYGRVWGGLASYVGAVISVNVTLVVVRAVGGQPLGELRARWARKLLDRLESNPVRSVAILRMMLWMTPPLNYTLALSPVSMRHHFWGSLIGLIPPLTIATIFFDWLWSVV